MGEDNRWNDRDRDWRDDRSREDRERGRDFGRGGYGNRGYQAGGGSADERWRQMHRDRRSEGPAGYNDSGPVQGGWEFGDEGARGQGYDRSGYGRSATQDRPYSSQASYGGEREYGRGGGYYSQGQGQDSQRWRTSTDRRGYGETYGGAGYRGFSSEGTRERTGEYGDARPDGENRSWLERAGDRVAEFFGAEDTGSHRGRGPKGYRRSDDRIRDDINDRLTDDAWLDASGISVEVKECEVTLSGAVNSREDKRRAEDLAEAISGVRHVQNNLRIEASDGRWSDQSQTTGSTTTASSAVQDVSSGKDQKGLGGATGRQAE